MLLQLLLKGMYLENLETTSQLAAAMQLAPPMIDRLLEEATKRNLVEIMGQVEGSGGVGAAMRYALSQAGKTYTQESLEITQYFGPAPVPFEAYQQQVLRQKISNEHVTREMLDEAFQGLVTPDRFLSRLGPAVRMSFMCRTVSRPMDRSSRSSTRQFIAASTRPYRKGKKRPASGARTSTGAGSPATGPWSLPVANSPSKCSTSNTTRKPNSGTAILIYGPAGNGKTTAAEIVGDIFQNVVYVPHCFEADGQIIKVFDPTIHRRIDKAIPEGQEASSLRRENIDRRWVPCYRPMVIPVANSPSKCSTSNTTRKPNSTRRRCTSRR